MAEAINPVDWEECLRLSNNKPDLARDILNMFAEELPKLQQHIHQAWQNQDIAQLGHYVHQLHGACCYSCVPRLRPHVAHMENCIKKKQLAGLNAMLQTLDAEIELVLNTLKEKQFITE